MGGVTTINFVATLRGVTNTELSFTVSTLPLLRIGPWTKTGLHHSQVILQTPENPLSINTDKRL
jgi:hypothetical protein